MTDDQQDTVDASLSDATDDGTEFISDAVRNMETPAAWSEANDEPDDEKEEGYPPTDEHRESNDPESLWQAWRESTKPWWSAIGIAAAVLIVTAIIATLLIVGANWVNSATPTPRASEPPGCSTVRVDSVPVLTCGPPQSKSPDEQINDAFTENIDGVSTLAFNFDTSAGADIGTAVAPRLQIEGSSDQRDDVTRKLHALGINANTDPNGKVTTVSFQDMKTKTFDPWDAWKKWYDDAHDFVSNVMAAGGGYVPWGDEFRDAATNCASLRSGENAADVLRSWQSKNPGTDLYLYVHAAVLVYCPEFKSQPIAPISTMPSAVPSVPVPGKSQTVTSDPLTTPPPPNLPPPGYTGSNW